MAKQVQVTVQVHIVEMRGSVEVIQLTMNGPKGVEAEYESIDGRITQICKHPAEPKATIRRAIEGPRNAKTREFVHNLTRMARRAGLAADGKHVVCVEGVRV